MADLVITKYAGQLPAQLNILTSARVLRGSTVERNSLQRIGLLTSNAGQVHTVYYDPAADAIIYDNGAVNPGSSGS